MRHCWWAVWTFQSLQLELTFALRTHAAHVAVIIGGCV